MKAKLPASPTKGAVSCEFQQAVCIMDLQTFLGTRANLPIVQKVNTQGNRNQIPQYLIQLFTKQKDQYSWSFVYCWQVVFMYFITNKTILLDNIICHLTNMTKQS